MPNPAPDSEGRGLVEVDDAGTSVNTMAAEMASVAPKPTRLEDTGLSRWLLADLTCKHLAEAGVLDLGELSQRLALPGSVVEDIVSFLRAEARVELRSRRDNNPLLRFALTDAGHNAALDAADRDGYVGPAPVPLELYERLVTAQSVRRYPITRDQVAALFADTVIRDALLDRLGPATHSGRAIFIHGDSGTGKSFIARRLHRLLGPPVLLPHALAVGESVIPYFDPSLHKLVDAAVLAPTTRLSQGFDARLLRCERPLVAAGGELATDSLELRFDRSIRCYAAPLQLKANCGLFIIDDLGRQQMKPEALLNRWIVPMEERRDQLSLNSGRHFSVPFDLTLVFSSNLAPRDLADEAFLRRIGYKVRFEEASPDEYSAIWRQVCRELGIVFDEDLLAFVRDELHAGNQVPLMQCYPRDLLQLASDYRSYMGLPKLEEESLIWAWQTYFLES